MNYRLSPAACLAGLVALLPASCAKPLDLCTEEGGACLTVQVSADDPSGPLIDRLRAIYTLDAAEQKERQFAGPAEAPGGSMLPLAFALTLPRGGAVHLDVIAEQRLLPALRGAADATLSDGEHQQVSVTLSPDLNALPYFGPAPRHHAGMVYFPPRQSVVLFGGIGSGGEQLSDTWELDPASGAWTARPGAGPAGRQATLAYDPTQKRVVLTGGADAKGQLIGDLWFYDSSGVWTQEVGNRGGGNRVGAGMTVTDTGVTVLYGGTDSAGTVLQDLLTLDAVTKPGTDFSPRPVTALRVRSPRLVSTTVPAAGSVFLLGADLNNPSSGISVWQLNGNFAASGTAITATPAATDSASVPPRRSDFTVAADSAAGLIYLFGGTSDSTTQYLQDAYVFSATARQWTRLTTTAMPAPLARTGAQLAWLPSGVLLKGGLAAPPGPPIALDSWDLTISSFTAPELAAVFTRRP